MTLFTMLVLIIAMSLAEIIPLAVAAVVGVLLATSVFGKKLAPLMKELKEAVDLYGKAKSADSPGGEELTDAEKEKLKTEALDILEAAWQSYGQGIIKWITRMFRK